MTWNDTLHRLRQADPWRDDDLRDWDLSGAERELVDEIASAPPLREAEPARRQDWLRPPVRSRLLVGAASVVVAIAVVASGFHLLGDDGDDSAFAAAAVRVAEANPRLLVTAPGWEVVRANQFERDEGDIAFSDGEHELEMTWYPARWYQTYYDDRTPVDRTPTQVTVLGEPRRTVRYGEHRDDFATMLPPEGDVFVEIRADLPEADYEQVVGSIEAVDVDTWLSAMPPNVVQPADRPAAVQKLLEGVPLAPGFDQAALENDPGVRDRYQFIAQVSSAVACGWLDMWAAGMKSGDEAQIERSVDALQTSHDWPMLHEIADQGGFSQVVWEFADRAQERDRTLLDDGGVTIYEDGTKFTYGPAYAMGLGCDSEVRRRVTGG